MDFIQLVHWNQSEAAGHAEILRKSGYEVRDQMGDVRALLIELRREPPQAVVIDLGRIPSQGRDFALAVRLYKDTRRVPILMVGGDPEKLKRIREQVPDAVYTSWDDAITALNEAISHPPSNPIQPRSLFDGYSGKPMVEKLGIRSGSLVSLVEAPDDFEQSLGTLPEGARLVRGISVQGAKLGSAHLVIWFIRDKGALEKCIAEMGSRQDFRSLWMVWPKKGSGTGSRLSQQEIRQAGLDAGLVDYKIASIDATWTGLLFTHRKK